MAVRESPFQLPPLPVSMTDGETVVTFDTPADFADWYEEHLYNLNGWHWVAGLVVSDN
jgi:hypothetical protein